MNHNTAPAHAESTPLQESQPTRTTPSPILIVFLIIPLLGILAAVGLALNENNVASQPLPTPMPVSSGRLSLIDLPAPNFELTNLQDERIRLSNYRGRVVFVNFWATWCKPCEEELPTLQRFVEAQGDDGAVVLAVNVAESGPQVTTFFDKLGVSGLNVLLDTNLDVYTAYDLEVLPTTFVIDPSGTVRYKHLGELTEDSLNGYINRLSQ